MYGAAPVDSVAVPVEVELYPDSAAMINVAGAGFKHVPVLDNEAASSAVGAGGHKLSGLGHGRADLFFPATALLESRRAADLPGGALGNSGGAHVKLAVHADWECLHSPSKNVLLLEGPLFRGGGHAHDTRPAARITRRGPVPSGLCALRVRHLWDAPSVSVPQCFAWRVVACRGCASATSSTWVTRVGGATSPQMGLPMC